MKKKVVKILVVTLAFLMVFAPTNRILVANASERAYTVSIFDFELEEMKEITPFVNSITFAAGLVGRNGRNSSEFVAREFANVRLEHTNAGTGNATFTISVFLERWNGSSWVVASSSTIATAHHHQSNSRNLLVRNLGDRHRVRVALGGGGDNFTLLSGSVIEFR